MTWYKTDASGMADVALADNGLVWLAGKNGTLWSYDRQTFTKISTPEQLVLPDDPAGKLNRDFRRVAVGNGGAVWTVGSDGSLWKYRGKDFAKTDASGIGDVAVSRVDDAIWLAGANGTVWTSNDDGGTFSQVPAEGFRAISVGQKGVVWAVGFNETLWYLENGQWLQTPASGMRDVGSSPESRRTYLVGENGTVWYTDDGKDFRQLEATGFSSIASTDSGDVVGRDAWAVGKNGTLWHFNEPILH